MTEWDFLFQLLRSPYLVALVKLLQIQGAMTAKQISVALDKHIRTIKNNLTELQEKGFVRKIPPSRGSAYLYELTADPEQWQSWRTMMRERRP